MTSVDQNIDLSVVSVTPDMALQWLAQANLHNRRLRQAKVNSYARDMANGKWLFNGDPLRFTDEGMLIDGQHRLAAIIKAETAVPMVIIGGLAMDAQETIDTGARRVFSDQLQLRGERNTTMMAAILRRLVLIDSFGTMSTGGTGARVPTEAEMYEYLSGHHKDVDRAAEVAKMASGNGLRAAPSMIGVAYYLAAEKSRPDADLFFVERLINMIGLTAGDPAHVLRMRFQSDERLGKAMTAEYVFRFTILAWNHWRSGNMSLQRLVPPREWPALLEVK